MTAHRVERHSRVSGRIGRVYGFGRFPSMLLLLTLAVPATAQEPRRQIHEMEARIADLQTAVAALEKEHFQQTGAIETNRKHLDEDELAAAAGKNWEAAAEGFRARLEGKKRAYDEACARAREIAPEDHSWLDHVGLGFIKAPQRRIPRSLSATRESIDAWWDWLTHRGIIDEELRAGITLPHEAYPRRFDGFDEFLRLTDGEILKSETARANAVSRRQNIARAERRLREIDGELRPLRTQIRTLEEELVALRNRPVEPATPERPRIPPDLADPEIVDATCSQLEGSPGGRVAFWRFYVRLNVRNHVPVQLRMTELTREPPAQDPEARRRFPAPRASFSVRPGDTFQLSGWEDPMTGVPILEQMAPTGVETIPDLQRIPAQRDLGPYYLTVWEAQGFQGRFSAAFEAVRETPESLRRVVEFRPLPPPTSQVQMRIDSPDINSRQGPAGALMPSFAWHDPYHIRVTVYVPDLTPGLHRLRIQVRGRRDRFLWARARETEQQTCFHGWVPMDRGPYELTLSMPEAPQVAPTTISGQLEPARGSTEQLAGSQKRVQEAQARLSDTSASMTAELRRWWLGDAQVAYAQRLNLAGHFAEALQVAEQAIGNLPEYHAAARTTAIGREYRHAAWKEQAIALYHLCQRDAFREMMQRICHTKLRIANEFRQQDNASVARDYERRAGLYGHLLAHRLMLIGGDLAEVRQIVEQGNQLYQRSGTNPPKLVWYPE